MTLNHLCLSKLFFFKVFGLLLTIVCLNLNLTYKQRKIQKSQQIEIEEEIITDFYQHYLLPKQSRQQESVCRLPRLNNTGHENIEKYKDCQMKSDWGYLNETRWYFNLTVVPDYSKYNCTYSNISRTDDFNLMYSHNEKLSHQLFIPHDVIEVNCTSMINNTKTIVYSNLHVQIINKIHLKKKTNVVDTGECKPLNILLISYDSISRVSWFKRLPKTTEYLIKNMKTTILYGHNIVGDGTPACMIPVLTGSTEEELPSTLKSDPNGQYVDQAYPFIWNDMHDKGYMSFHMEDWPQVSAFTYRLRGFSNKTAHHYMRSYQLALWKRIQKNYFSNKDDLCIGSIKRNKKALNLIQEFIEMYKKKSNYVSIMHYIENSHDGNERANFLDQDLKNFLQFNFETGNFDNTAVFIYSDHGNRFAAERWTSQGDLEERLPFVSLYLPKNYIDSYPEKYKNLLKNSQQLTTPFDIHATLRELSCTQKNNIKEKLRMRSLLSEIPLNRTCQSIGLSVHYCVCELEWKNVEIKDKFSIKAAHYMIDYLNKVLDRAKEYCYQLTLHEINYVKIANVNLEYYVKINFVTKPNNAHYEALIKYDEKEKKLLITSTDSISRLNAYGKQPRCLDYAPPSKKLTIDLRKFCLCKPKRGKKG
ncbi:unnamed protein product [Brachionus calyciflorus]|uniref:DUF229 domain containing protein n=1 Tax=Brachionus calyciflorus TaxID=104777 RepID=A0A813WGU8_9BILA|nr:unnamed protein product [Brachionus calyciflorus]